MQEDIVPLNTTLFFYFYDLWESRPDVPDGPRTKGFGFGGPYSVLPKDKRLQALVLLIEIGSKLDVIDKHIGGPARRFLNPHIEESIHTFAEETGLSEDDVRRLLKRPRPPAAIAPGADPPPEQPHVMGVVDP